MTLLALWHFGTFYLFDSFCANECDILLVCILKLPSKIYIL